MGLLAKVNWALEAITKMVEKEKDKREYGRVMNLGVLPGPRSINFIPDLVVQDISEVGWGGKRFDEDKTDKEDDREEEEIHSSDFDQHSTEKGNNADVDKNENPAYRELASKPEDRTNTSKTEELGNSQTQEEVESSSSLPNDQPTQISLSRPDKPPIILVGDIKLHSGWKHSMWRHVDSQGADFRQVLSQVNFYMTQNACKYGFVITEREVVAVYRPGRKGLLKLSGSFPIRTLGQEGEKGTYPSSPGDLCADEALLALILWAADPPSPETDPADETCDAEAEEDEYYPTIEAVAFSSDIATSVEKESVFS
jgi:hypothetical protein